MTMHLIPSSVAAWRTAGGVFTGMGLALLLFVVMPLFGWGIGYALRAETVEVVDQRMEAGCVMPRSEGESTFAVIYEGRFICWRNQ